MSKKTLFIDKFDISEVNELLADPDISIRDVAETLGYLEEKDFVSEYKEVTDVSPRVYRGRCNGSDAKDRGLYQRSEISGYDSNEADIDAISRLRMIAAKDARKDARSEAKPLYSESNDDENNKLDNDPAEEHSNDLFDISDDEQDEGVLKAQKALGILAIGIGDVDESKIAKIPSSRIVDFEPIKRKAIAKSIKVSEDRKANIIALNVSGQFTTHAFKTPEHPEIQTAIDYINDIKLEEGNLTISSISKATGCPRWLLDKIFEPETGIKITEFIKLRRLEEAKHIIANTDENISSDDLAEKVGIKSGKALGKMFEKRMGQSLDQFTHDIKANRDELLNQKAHDFIRNNIDDNGKCPDEAYAELYRDVVDLEGSIEHSTCLDAVTVFDKTVEKIDRERAEIKRIGKKIIEKSDYNFLQCDSGVCQQYPDDELVKLYQTTLEIMSQFKGSVCLDTAEIFDETVKLIDQERSKLAKETSLESEHDAAVLSV